VLFFCIDLEPFDLNSGMLLMKGSHRCSWNTLGFSPCFCVASQMSRVYLVSGRVELSVMQYNEIDVSPADKSDIPK
jgi:hypothetical protein